MVFFFHQLIKKEIENKINMYIMAMKKMIMIMNMIIIKILTLIIILRIIII
jgi:hypothetical protein